MNKEEMDLEVIVHEELDLQKIPKDMFDAFITAVVDNITKSLREDSVRKSELKE